MLLRSLAPVVYYEMSCTFKGIQLHLWWMIMGKSFRCLGNKKNLIQSLVPSLATWKPLILFLIQHFLVFTYPPVTPAGWFFEKSVFQIQELPTTGLKITVLRYSFIFLSMKHTTAQFLFFVSDIYLMSKKDWYVMKLQYNKDI